MNRILAALFAVGTLASMAWYAYWLLPQRLLVPGFTPVFLSFFAGLAFPYLVTLGLLAVRDGRDGFRCGCGTALVNAAWSLPLATVLVLFSGFTVGNRDQVQSLLAVVSGALLQIPLLAVSGIALWHGRRRETVSSSLSDGRVWLFSLLLPAFASGGSFLSADRQFREFKAHSAQAARNSRAARETVKMLQGCLAKYRDTGYPAGLDVCADERARLGKESGYRFEYLPAFPDSKGGIGAYMLCAQPLSFRATGFDTVVVDSTGSAGAEGVVDATLENSPTCSSVLGIERVISWCAYAFAARNPATGYPERLSEMATCVAEKRQLGAMGVDQLSEAGVTYAYLADPPDEQGRIVRFRVYRLGGADGSALWVDDQLRPSNKRHLRAGPTVAGLPDLADPERFAPGCNEGRGNDCFLAGYEWQRKAKQTGTGEKEPAALLLQENAILAFSRGCDLQEARSCVQLAEDLLDREAGRDVVGAAALLAKACTLGDLLGCRRAGEMYESGSSVHIATLQSPSPPPASGPDLRRDVGQAVAFYGRACDLGDRDACFIAGRLLAAGTGIAPDNAGAVAFLDRACEDGMALACSRAAILAPRRAQEFRRRACVLGEASECR